MIKLIALAASAVLVLAVAPASAAKMAACTQKNIDKTDAMINQMPMTNMKKMTGMNEMSQAKMAMGQKDMKGCMTHLDAAMKAGMSK